MRNLLIILTLLLISGCAGTREITDLTPHLPDNSPKTTIKEIKEQYFTQEAYKQIKDIPLIDGPAFSAYAPGVNFWSNLASFISCNGIGRKVIAPSDSIKKWGLAVIIHEYVHHLDDMDRDGDAEFINHEEFKKAYLLMSKDMQFAGIVRWVELQCGDTFTTNTFGVGDYGEHIAYVAQHLATKNGPPYMKHVFRLMLKFQYPKTFIFRSTDGTVSQMSLSN